MSSNSSCQLRFLSLLSTLACLAASALLYLSFELRMLIEQQLISTADVFQFASLYPEGGAARDSWDALQSYYTCCGGVDSNNG